MENDEKKIKLFEESKKLIEAKNLFFFQDVIAYLPVSCSTFYDYFPEGSDEHTELKRLLEQNKIEVKVGLRKQMYQIGNPTAMLALYKLIATPEEREALMKNVPDRKKAKVDSVNNTQINVNVYTDIVTQMLKTTNRYSPAMMPEVEALASAMATLNSANKVIDNLTVPFVEETTTQGTKVVIHPAYTLQKSALESVSKHSKLLGLDYENMPNVSTEGPLERLTKEMIDITKPSQGHISVSVKKKKQSKK